MPEIQVIEPIETDVALLDPEVTLTSLEVQEVLVVYLGLEVPPSYSSLATNLVWNEVPSGSIDGINAAFTTLHIPTGLSVFLNGLKQTAGAGNDYTLSGQTITFNADCIPQTGDVIEVNYRY